MPRQSDDACGRSNDACGRRGWPRVERGGLSLIIPQVHGRDRVQRQRTKEAPTPTRRKRTLARSFTVGRNNSNTTHARRTNRGKPWVQTIPTASPQHSYETGQPLRPNTVHGRFVARTRASDVNDRITLVQPNDDSAVGTRGSILVATADTSHPHS